MTLESLQESVRIVPFVLPIVLLAFALHEMAHAYVATWFGDPTPEQHGRRTLNPIKHLDKLGSIMLVVSLLLFGFPMGFAVTPVNDRKLRSPRLHGALVAVAGPVTNVILCAIWMILYIWAIQSVGPDSFRLGDNAPAPLLIEAAYYGMVFNAFLAVFNMLPIPPLDGGRIIGTMLKPELAREWEKISQYGILILLGLILLGGGAFQQLISTLNGMLIAVVEEFVTSVGFNGKL